MDDKQLNKYVSLKKLRPYSNLDDDGNEIPERRRDVKYNEYKLKKLRQEVKDDLEMKR